MDDSKTIIIKDNCDKGILGIITVNGASAEYIRDYIEEALSTVKSKFEGCWTMENLIEELETMDLSFSWSTDFETIYD